MIPWCLLCDAHVYLGGVLQALEASLGRLLQLLRASAEVLHLLDPALRLENLAQLPLPFAHGLQVAMETPALSQ